MHRGQFLQDHLGHHWGGSCAFVSSCLSVAPCAETSSHRKLAHHGRTQARCLWHALGLNSNAECILERERIQMVTETLKSDRRRLWVSLDKLGATPRPLIAHHSPAPRDTLGQQKSSQSRLGSAATKRNPALPESFTSLSPFSTSQVRSFSSARPAKVP